MYDHMFTINADKYTVTTENGIVTGKHGRKWYKP